MLNLAVEHRQSRDQHIQGPHFIFRDLVHCFLPSGKEYVPSVDEANVPLKITPTVASACRIEGTAKCVEQG